MISDEIDSEMLEIVKDIPRRKDVHDFLKEKYSRAKIDRCISWLKKDNQLEVISQDEYFQITGKNPKDKNSKFLCLYNLAKDVRELKDKMIILKEGNEIQQKNAVIRLDDFIKIPLSSKQIYELSKLLTKVTPKIATHLIRIIDNQIRDFYITPFPLDKFLKNVFNYIKDGIIENPKAHAMRILALFNDERVLDLVEKDIENGLAWDEIRSLAYSDWVYAKIVLDNEKRLLDFADTLEEQEQSNRIHQIIKPALENKKKYESEIKKFRI